MSFIDYLIDTVDRMDHPRRSPGGPVDVPAWNELVRELAVDALASNARASPVDLRSAAACLCGGNVDCERPEGRSLADCAALAGDAARGASP